MLHMIFKQSWPTDLFESKLTMEGDEAWLCCKLILGACSSGEQKKENIGVVNALVIKEL